MRVQQGYAFVGHTLLRPNSNVNWIVGESPIPPELWRRGRPEDEVLRRWKGEMQTRTRAIGAAKEAPLRTGGFRMPRTATTFSVQEREWSGERSGYVRGSETELTRLHCATGTCFPASGGRYGAVVAWKGIRKNRWRCYVGWSVNAPAARRAGCPARAIARWRRLQARSEVHALTAG